MRILKHNIWPYKISTNVGFESVDELELWLGNHVGGFKIKWNAVYKYNGTDYYFKDSKDATMFALKWV